MRSPLCALLALAALLALLPCAAAVAADAAAPAQPRDVRVPRGPDDEPTAGMFTPEEEAGFAAHVRVLTAQEQAAEQNEKLFRFTKYLVENASPGCQEELDEVMALGNATTGRASVAPDSLFSEECDLEFGIYRQEFEDIENQEYAKSLKERRKRMEKMQSAGDMSGMEEL